MVHSAADTADAQRAARHGIAASLPFSARASSESPRAHTAPEMAAVTGPPLGSGRLNLCARNADFRDAAALDQPVTTPWPPGRSCAYAGRSCGDR